MSPGDDELEVHIGAIERNAPAGAADAADAAHGVGETEAAGAAG